MSEANHRAARSTRAIKGLARAGQIHIPAGGRTISGAGMTHGQHPGMTCMVGHRTSKQGGRTLGGRILTPPQTDGTLRRHLRPHRTAKTPPTPRRQRQEQLSKPGADGGRQEDPTKGEAAKVMAAIKSKPQNTRNRRRGASPGPNSAVHTAGEDDASAEMAQQTQAPLAKANSPALAPDGASGSASKSEEAATKSQSASAAHTTTTRSDHPDKRPSATVTSLNVKEPDTLGRSSTAGPEEAMDRQGQQNAQSSALSRDSDDVELIQSDQEKDSQSEVKAYPPLREQPSSGSQAPASASGGPSREDRPGGDKCTRSSARLCPDSCVTSPSCNWTRQAMRSYRTCSSIHAFGTCIPPRNG